MALTVTQIKGLPPGRHADGRGLYLYVQKSGARSWVLLKQFRGRRPEYGLGSWPEVSLADARKKAARYVELISQGKDPRLPSLQSKATTFAEAAVELIESRSQEWKNSKHSQQWPNTLKTYVYPSIGNLPVEQVTTEHVLAILQPIWSTKTETARRVQGRIASVIDYYNTKTNRSADNPARWKGRLSYLLSKPDRVHRTKHHPAMDFRALPEFYSRLTQQKATSALALRVLILTALRTTEVRAARWDEFDLDEGLWSLPASRMKAKERHVVALSDAARDLLRQIPRQSDYLFPSNSGSGQPNMSESAMLLLLRRMGISNLTVHGFRSTFRDWAGETTDFASRTIEYALAHQLADKSEASYARGTHLAKRRDLMNAWGRYCLSGINPENVERSGDE